MIQNVLSFEMSFLRSAALVVVPCVDGVPLKKSILLYEEDRKFEKIGGYGGLAPSHYKFGSLDEYFLGKNSQSSFIDGKIFLLGCQCGEVRCWPLMASVHADETSVTWTGFVQPHRPNHDYSAFGPFRFIRVDYELALAQLIKDADKLERTVGVRLKRHTGLERQIQSA